MQLKVKPIDIATHGTLVAVINKEDARLFDIHPLDRLKISKRSKVQSVFVDITDNNKVVPRGSIGLFAEP